LDCLENQTCRDDILPIIVDASDDNCCDTLWVHYSPITVLHYRGAYWGQSLRRLQDYARKHLPIRDKDIVCILNIDRTFCRDYINLGSKYVKDNQLVISHCLDEKGNHVSGGLQVVWSKFHFALSQSPNICGTNGLFMSAKNFTKAKISRFLPHHWADFQLVLSLVKQGCRIYEPIQLVLTLDTKCTGIHNPKSWKELFDIRCSCNPVYMAIFVLLCCPLRYKPINLLRCLWWTIKVKL